MNAFGPADFAERLKRQYKAGGHTWFENLHLPEGVTHTAQQLATSSNAVIIALARRFLGGLQLKSSEADKLSITIRRSARVSRMQLPYRPEVEGQQAARGAARQKRRVPKRNVWETPDFRCTSDRHK